MAGILSQNLNHSIFGILSEFNQRMLSTTPRRRWISSWHFCTIQLWVVMAILQIHEKSHPLQWYHMTVVVSQVPSTRLFVKQFMRANGKGNNKGPHHWSFVRGNHRWPVDSPHKRPVMRKKVPMRWRHHVVKHVVCVNYSCNLLFEIDERQNQHRGPLYERFSPVIQIWWKFHSPLTQFVVKWSLWNLALGTKAVLSWHVQNFVTIWSDKIR